MDAKWILTSKTFWANLVVALLATGAAVAPVLPPRWAAVTLAGVAVGNIWLRFITNQPVTLKPVP